jgi:AcrR family transcriptional regulator
MKEITTLKPAAEQLLITAERLLAEKGLGAVSTREIAREAGQKNHSALNYHFGSMELLIEAILDHRMLPLNRSRAEKLASVITNGLDRDLRSLVEVMVEPFAGELLLPLEQSYYLSLLSQIIEKGDWQAVFTQYEYRSSAALDVGALLQQVLCETHSEELVLERLQLMGLQIMTTITQWNTQRRRGELVIDKNALEWRVKNLVDMVVGGLTANSSI